MSSVTSARQYLLPLGILLHRLEVCQEDEARFFDQLDIGGFPNATPAASQSLRELGSIPGLRFLKWLHRSNGSDVALIEHSSHALRVLKIVSVIDAHHGRVLTGSA
jgi:hypothetical protein